MDTVKLLSLVISMRQRNVWSLATLAAGWSACRATAQSTLAGSFGFPSPTPKYMPGLLRTATSNSSTSMSAASYEYSATTHTLTTWQAHLKV
ncbi:hypothetical protein T45_04152 [Streptomyces turgidiscabies]|nr:hypothetical protein T45_04152 [Streptomyces turgidiscabies]